MYRNRCRQSSPLVTLHRLDEPLIALVGVVAVHHEQRVNNARHDAEQPQAQVQQRLDWLADHQHRNRRDNNGEEVQHLGLLIPHNEHRNAIIAHSVALQTNCGAT